MSDCKWWACNVCWTAVLIPIAVAPNGGVCTQQSRGCGGDLVALDADAVAAVRSRIPLGVREQAWLTLVPSKRG